MTERTSKPPPKAAGKVAILCAAVVCFIIIITFVGMNFQHAQDMRDEQNGQVKPQNAPMTDKDLGKSPVQAK